MKSALIKVRSILAKSSQVLSMNQRNLEYVYPNNSRVDFPIADDKLLTKRYLEDASVPFPKNYHIYGYFFDLRTLAKDLADLHDFVIKPARGSGGGGIIVIVRKDEHYWYGVNGKPYSVEDIRRHLCDIIFGIYSFGIRDEAIIEQRILQHPTIDAIAAMGLADVRVIMYNDYPALAMMRLPTRASEGRANLHQGAIGVGIDIETGTTHHATMEGGFIDRHPDTGNELIGKEIAYWKEIIEIAKTVSKTVPLKYLGIDVALSVDGPKILEINVRPGIEIQNVNNKGMRDILSNIGTNSGA